MYPYTRSIVVTMVLFAISHAFSPVKRNMLQRFTQRNVISITDGVEFDTIAREWRCKWSADDNKSSLAAVQKALNSVIAEVKSVEGVKSVQRIVCGGCLDYKIVVALPADKFGAWEQKKFSPESKFLSAISSIPGVTQVETQTYTLMPVNL